MGIEFPNSGPGADQIEIVLFGPGFGECILIHVGDDNWIIVDSCVDIDTKQAPALQYLETIGRSSDCVQLIIATHWHDDHVRGLAHLVEQCPCARFCCSSALGLGEFLMYVELFRVLPATKKTSGVQEISKVTAVLNDRGGAQAKRIAAAENKRVFYITPEKVSHCRPVEVWTLSPSEAQYETFLREVRDFIETLEGNPNPRKMTIRRSMPRRPNNTSVVAWIHIGEVAILLGADLENVGSAQAGWIAVVSSEARPRGKAVIFKLPHHGSKNAHEDRVWAEMLIDHPYAILTPYSRGTRLPTNSDVERTLERTDNAYITAKQQKRTARSRPAAVEKTIRTTVRRIRSLSWASGHIQLRNRGKAGFSEWKVTLAGGACHLRELTDGNDR